MLAFDRYVAVVFFIVLVVLVHVQHVDESVLDLQPLVNVCHDGDVQYVERKLVVNVVLQGQSVYSILDRGIFVYGLYETVEATAYVDRKEEVDADGQ